jgi:hypothetical protein
MSGLWSYARAPSVDIRHTSITANRLLRLSSIQRRQIKRYTARTYMYALQNTKKSDITYRKQHRAHRRHTPSPDSTMFTPACLHSFPFTASRSTAFASRPRPLYLMSHFFSTALTRRASASALPASASSFSLFQLRSRMAVPPQGAESSAPGPSESLAPLRSLWLNRHRLHTHMPVPVCPHEREVTRGWLKSRIDQRRCASPASARVAWKRHNKHETACHDFR